MPLRFLVLLAIYLLPTIVAGRGDHPNTSSIAVINIFWDWTVIGWIVALAFAMSSSNRNTRNPCKNGWFGGVANSSHDPFLFGEEIKARNSLPISVVRDTNIPSTVIMP